MAKAKSASFSRPSSSFRLHSPSLNWIRLRRIFDIFDKNGDGIISVDELTQALDLLGLETDSTEIESIVSSYVRPGISGLDFENFKALHQSLGDTFFGTDDSVHDDCKTEEDEKELTEAFKVFDIDGDGFISAKELQVVLSKLGMPECHDFGRVERMICSVDRNQDGRVDIHEFKNMMQSITVRSS
ncbi:hypothetical protein NE237_021574 [Protea cynaroides]|uniref:EF-hand domain-containing protein n=1 Tax=Protea cynaroides TaxID=273540 RepID=A0A9Q0H9B6_9MAGN|nr:hypothetical protein NE237_021574 [Protea cynaroides]